MISNTNIVYLITLLLILIGCSSQDDQERVKVDHFEINNNGQLQSFNVILMDNLVREYLVASKNANPELLKKLYEEKVFEPISDYCLKDGEYLHLLGDIRNRVPEDIDSLEKVVEEKNKLSEVREIIKSALIDSSTILMGPNTNVCVLPSSSDREVAFTVGTGKIIILYNPDLYRSPNELVGTVAHEYHHSVWTKDFFNKYKPFKLLDHIIFEGKALYFQELVYPNSTYLPDYSNKHMELRNELNETLHTMNREYISEVMFGDSKFPYAFGYSEGYQIVANYLKEHPELDVMGWTQLEPENFVKR